MAISGKLIFSVALAVLALTAYKLYSQKNTTPLLGKQFTSVSWDNCGGSYFDVTNVVISGVPAVGETVTVTISGNANSDFVHGSTYWETSYSIWGVQATGNDPVNPPQAYTPGPFTMTSVSTLNRDPPTGKYQTRNQFRDANGNTFQCVLIRYQITN